MPGSPRKKRDIQKRFYKKLHQNYVKESFEDLSRHFLEEFLRMEDFFLKTVWVRLPLMPLQVSETAFGWGSWKWLFQLDDSKPWEMVVGNHHFHPFKTWLLRVSSRFRPPPLGAIKSTPSDFVSSSTIPTGCSN